MKHIVYILMFWMILFLSACGGGNHKTTTNNIDINNTISQDINSTDEETNSTYTISGMAQKGSFINGEVTVYKMDNGKPTDILIQSSIDKLGNYIITLSKEGLYLFKAKGKFFNEYTGENSTDEVELFSLVNLTKKLSNQKININLFTSLEYERVSYLISQKGFSYEKALEQAKIDLDKAVGLSKSIEPTSLNIYDLNGTLKNQNANLLLFSALLLKVSDVEDTQTSKSKNIEKLSKGFLSKFYNDFKDDGKFNRGFQGPYEGMKRGDRGDVWERVVKNLGLKGIKVPKIPTWGELVPISTPTLIPLPTPTPIPTIPISTTSISEFKFWGTKIDNKLFNYNNSNTQPTAMFIATPNNSVLLRFTISFKGSGTIKVYAKSNNNTSLIYSKSAGSGGYRSMRLDIPMDNTIREFINNNHNVSFYATIGGATKDVISIPILAGLSEDMHPNTKIQTATYKGECANPSNYLASLNTFDAKMDIDGIFRDTTSVSYSDVCTKLSYKSDIDRFYPTLKSGFYGNLASPIYRTIGDNNVTFFVDNNRTDSEGITISQIKLLLPNEHSIHPEINYNISPRGTNYIILPTPINGRILANEELPKVFTGSLSDKYLHGKNLPFYFRLSDYELNQDGLKFSDTVVKYVFENNNRHKNNTERFKSPKSDPIDIWVDKSGITTKQNSISFDSDYTTTSYPYMIAQRGAFSVQIDNSKLIIPNNISRDTQLSMLYNQNCKSIGCENSSSFGSISLNNLNKTKLYSDGTTISYKTGKIGVVKWGIKQSSTAFKRENDENAIVYIPGFELSTNQADKITSYLLGTAEDKDNNISYYTLDNNLTKKGQNLFAGINIGNLKDNTIGSLEGKGMSISLGDQIFNLNSHKYSKYYIRPSGVTGLFNDEHKEYSPIAIYGYNTTFSQLKFRTIQNRVDDFTKIDGVIKLEGKAKFSVEFKHLGMNCRGDLKSGVIATDLATISAWRTLTEFTTLDFENVGGDICSATKELAIGHIMKIASLKDKIGAKVRWSSTGLPLHADITNSTFNQLDGNISQDNNNLSNGGYSVELEDLKLASSNPSENSQNWIESNMSFGLPFWGITDTSVRMENNDTHSRKATVVTGRGELFSNGRTTDQTSEVLVRNVVNQNYSQTVSKKWAGVFTFGLPVYYKSTDSKVPQFLGRTLKEDLLVMKAKAGVTYITPDKTSMSFGASADFEKLKGLKLHIDLNDPESIKEIDKTLDKYLHLGTPLDDTLGVLVRNINIGNKLLKDGLNLSMEKGAFLALKEAGKIDKDKDPFEILANLNAKVYAIPVMLNERFSSILKDGIGGALDSINNENIEDVKKAIDEQVKQYNRLVEDLNITRDIIKNIVNIDNNAGQLKKLINEKAFGSSQECSWTNFSTKGFFKPVGQVTSSLDKVNRELQHFKIAKITEFAKTASKYSGIDPKELVSLAKKIKSLSNDLNDLVNSQKSWIQQSFDKNNGFICQGMGEINNKLDFLYAKLAPFHKVITVVDANVTNIYNVVTSSEVKKVVDELKNITKKNATKVKQDIENNITTPILAQTESIVKFAQSQIPNLSADDMRRMAVTTLFKAPPVHELIKGINEQLTPVADELNKLSSMVFFGIDKSINKILAKVSTKINKILAKATSTLDKIPLSTASMDGYSTFYGDQLARLHIGSEFKIKGKDKDSSFSFNSALDIKNHAIDGTSGCQGAKSKGNLEATISTRDITMPIGDKKLKVDLILLGVNIDNRPSLNGIFGAISSKSGFNFNKFKLYNLGLATGIGSQETYLGAKANAKLDDLQLGVSFLVGVVCNKEVIETILPEAIYKFITIPHGKFNGATVFGEAQVPIWKNGCMLTVNARAKLGTWYLFGPPKTFGGIVGGAAFGKGLCIATLGGEIDILAEKSGDDVKFQGNGWGAAGVGWCDNSWSSVKDSRNDDWCGTGDAQFGAKYHNGWKLMDIKTSAVH